ncbi:MAG: hypothetical protein KC776_38990 [Myxococcales bacterium]|nr:hypothetical protein [Myxococcales bacterium]MCB9578706.1 hypothetical protein [Polyangiaceae bacterium]
MKLRAIVPAAFVLLFGTAAQAVEQPNDLASSIDVSTPAPPPAVPRSYHVHDGFYFRAGIGTGPHWLKLKDDRFGADASTSGFDFSMEALVGGSPSEGFAIGGAFLFHALPSTEIEIDGRGTGVDPNVGVALIGPFVDGFPDPKRGFHVGGTLGIVGVQFSKLDATDEKRESNGFGGAVWVGNDFWVGDEWSIGPSLRFMTTVTTDSSKDTDLTVTTRALTLSMTVLYH